eukprot:m.102643 g.102643  ORF g.102643 m.102643 type:complete len:421 (+) comp12547_c0_seq2:195-1457(+)
MLRKAGFLGLFAQIVAQPFTINELCGGNFYPNNPIQNTICSIPLQGFLDGSCSTLPAFAVWNFQLICCDAPTDICGAYQTVCADDNDLIVQTLGLTCAVRSGSVIQQAVFEGKSCDEDGTGVITGQTIGEAAASVAADCCGGGAARNICNPETSSPTMSPTASPTVSPTASPTVSPTASPTTPCSYFTQTFTITDQTTCTAPPLEATSAKSSSKKGTSSPKGKSCRDRHANIGEAFLSLWESQAVFTTAEQNGEFTADGVINGDPEVTSVWDNVNNQWVHTVVVEYRPESPISHLDLVAAARNMASSFSVTLCDCSVVVDVDFSTSGYIMATDDSFTPKGGKCKGRYTPKKSPKSKKSPKFGALVAVSTTTAATGVVGVGMVAVMALGVVVKVAIRRHRSNPHDVDERTALVASPTACLE